MREPQQAGLVITHSRHATKAIELRANLHNALFMMMHCRLVVTNQNHHHNVIILLAWRFLTPHVYVVFTWERIHKQSYKNLTKIS